MKDIKLLIATHRSYQMPSERSVYLPVQVGASGKESLGYQRDDEGDNISQKNPKYCELTALYWGWKNLDCDYLGLVHYRRYFAGKKTSYKEGMAVDEVAISKKQLESLLEQTDIVVPKKRNYYIETLYSHYANTFDKSHLDKTRVILADLHPEQVAVFDQTMAQKTGYMFNMYVMKKDLSDAYCAWLFPILDALVEQVDTSDMTAFEARYVGRVSELLFNVWLNLNDYSVVEQPVIYLEKVNWLKKGSSFLRAKFFKKKYDKSF